MILSPRVRTSFIVVGYLGLFLTADIVAGIFEILPGISLWYPPPGLALALLLVLGPRWLPLALGASLASAFFVYPMPEMWATAAMACGATGGYALVAILLRAWLGKPPRLEQMSHALGLAFVLLFSSVPIAFIGTMILQKVALVPPEGFGRALFHWWLGDAAGILSILPILLINVAPLVGYKSVTRAPVHRRTSREWLEIAGQAAAVLASLAAVYFSLPMRESHVPYLSFIPLTWIVLRHGLPGAGLAIFALNVGSVFVLRHTGVTEPVLISFLLFQFSTTAMGLGLGAMVTRRLRAETERHRLHEIVEATPDFVATGAPESGVLYCNTALRSLRGDRATSGGSLFSALQPAWAAEKMLREAMPAAQQHGRWSGESALLDAAGQEIPVSAVVVPHRDHDGETASAFFLVARDISEQRQAEQLRLEAERKMLGAQKLESLGLLAGSIAHDFNNLLTTMLGNASLARAEAPPSSTVQNSLQQIEHAALRAAELCQQMLAYSGKGQLKLTLVDLTALVNDTTHLLRVSIPKKTTLHFDLAAQLPPVRADATQLRQVMMNLVLNAADAIGDRPGEIRIVTGTMQADEAWLAEGVATPPPPPGDYVFVSVIDTGHGMSPATRARIFEPFFTTKFTGHGLGLSAVLGIVRSHRGTLHLESQVNAGSTFRIALPVAPGAVVRHHTPPADAPWRGHGTVLVVDDEEAVRIVSARILESCGFTTDTATDGREAIDRFTANPTRYRAVVLDLLMPVLDGEQALAQLRRVRHDLPALIMTGYSGRSGMAPSAGAPTAFLMKPFQRETLVHTLRNLLESADAAAPAPY